MLTLTICMFAISVLLFCISIRSISHTHTINKEIDIENERLENTNNILKSDNLNLQKEFDNYKIQVCREKENLNNLREASVNAADTQKELSQKAFENYCAILENSYETEEEKYNNKIKELDDSYNLQMNDIKDAVDQAKEELDKIQATRAAALQAQLKEKEIKEKLSFYCLKINQADLDDIKVLDRMKNQLHNPRILSMLIWKTYFQKPMTTLCNNILGTSTVCGIYKITNQINDMCYIGQSADVDRRWKEHAKCGLGIDPPAANKLYKSMQEDGLYNFSFELLEECPRDQLNEKEKYYISLYQSDKFGYNLNSGISK